MKVSSVSLDRVQERPQEKVTVKPRPRGKKELAIQSQGSRSDFHTELTACKGVNMTYARIGVSKLFL